MPDTKIRYVVGKKGSDKETPRLTVVRAADLLVTRTTQGSAKPPFFVDLREDGRKGWAHKDKEHLKRRVKNLLAAGDPGDEVWTWASNLKTRHTALAILVAPPVELPSQAVYWPSQKIKDGYIEILSTWVELSWGGTCNCRPPRGGSGYSNHACCKAHDFFVPLKNGQYDANYGDTVYEWLQKNKARLGISYVSWCGNKYKTECTYHRSHLHVSWGTCSSCY